MSKYVEQPADIGALPRLHDAATARAILRVGHNKWDRLQHELEYVLIGRRRFFTDAALLDYVKRQTKPAAQAPTPRRAPARKAVPVPPKARRHKAAAALERESD